MKSKNKFITFLLEKRQKREICILVPLLCILGIVYHHLYPYPFTFPDTGAYMLAAITGNTNIFRPMGYSWFISFIHNISGSIHFIFIASYLLHIVTSLYFVYSFKYLMKLENKYIFYTILFFVFLSPSILFCTNYLMSDGIFHSFTLIFLATALWIIYSPKIYTIVFHLMAFSYLYYIRYSGMFYLPISVFVLFLAYRNKNIFIRSLISIIPIILFFGIQSQAKNNYRKATNINVVSGFSGWQLLNNASVLFPEAKQIPINKIDSDKKKLLHQYITTLPDSLFTTEKALSSGLMWNNGEPLKQFMFYYMSATKIPYANAWPSMGELYGDYATDLILSHPFLFIKRFIWPSFLVFFRYGSIPGQSEFVNEDMYRSYYNIQIERYTSPYTLFDKINPIRHIFHYIYWLLQIFVLFMFVWDSAKIRKYDKNWQICFILIVFQYTYIGFSALASAGDWRYSIPIYVPSLLLMAYYTELLIKTSLKNKIK